MFYLPETFLSQTNGHVPNQNQQHFLPVYRKYNMKALALLSYNINEAFTPNPCPAPVDASANKPIFAIQVTDLGSENI